MAHEDGGARAAVFQAHRKGRAVQADGSSASGAPSGPGPQGGAWQHLRDVAALGADANVVETADGRRVDYTMKVFYAFAITFVVAGHVLSGPGTGGLNLAYNLFPPASFHVACFVFGAGYFYNAKHEASPLAFLKKRAVRLLVPLYAINALYGLWVLVSRAFGFSFGQDPTLFNLLLDPLFGGHAFLWDLSMWFVAPLFFTQVVDFGLRLLVRAGQSKRKELALIVVYLACGLLTTTLCGHDGFEEYSSHPLVLVGRVGFFLPCYAFGRIYRVFLAEYDTAPNWLYFGVVIAAQLALLASCGGSVGYIVSWCWFITGPVAPLAATALGIAFWLRVSRIAAPGLAGSGFAMRVADNTFSIMAHQFVGIFAVKLVFLLLMLVGVCPTFDVAAFLSDFWYYYAPDIGPSFSIVFGVLYVAGGVAVPLGMHELWLWMKGFVRGRRACSERSRVE